MNDMMQTGFDYAALPVDLAVSLKLHEDRFIAVRNRATYEMGKEIYEAQQELANNKNGCFQAWVEHLGISYQTGYDLITIYQNAGSDIIKLFDNKKLSQTVAVMLLRAPESVAEKAIAKAESGAKVTVADVKDWKAELDAATQRCEEFRQESNERRKTIRTLEEQIDLLTIRDRMMQGRLEKAEEEINYLATVVPEPEKIIVPPADYETAKAEAANLRQQLADVETQKDKLIQKQVVAKIKEREQEIAALEHQAEQLKGTITSYQAHIARVHLPELEMQQQLKAVEDFMRACAGLAASLALFEHAPNPATASVWQKGIAAATDAAQAMQMHTDRRPELTVIHGEAA